MKVLWITKSKPTRGKGGEYLYSRGIIDALSENSELKIVCYADNEGGEFDHSLHSLDVTEISARLNSDLSSVLSLLPNNSNRYWRREFVDAIVHCIGAFRPHAIILDSLAMAWLISVVNQFRTSTTIVYFSHNFETGLRKTIADANKRNWIVGAVRALDSAKTSRLERRVCTEVDLITAITSNDLRDYRELFPNTRSLLLLPGYDNIPDELRPLPDGRSVCIIGSFLWSTKRANLLQFLEQSFQSFKDGNVSLKIIGNMKDDFRRELLERYPHLVVTGPVASIEAESANCRAGLLIDSVGGGFKLKALDYIFLGLPIFALPGCMHGLELQPDVDYIERSDPQSLVRSLLDSFTDQRMNQMRLAAYQKSRVAFSWRDSGNSLYQFLRASRKDVDRAIQP